MLEPLQIMFVENFEIPELLSRVLVSRDKLHLLLSAFPFIAQPRLLVI